MNRDLSAPLGSIEFFLNPTIFSQEHLVNEISERLAKGHLIVIKNAFNEAFAERLFACLDQFNNWKLYKDYQPHFHYHHHNIYDDTLFPPELERCRRIFSSEGTRSFVERLAQRDCSGETTFSASLYLPGDYSLPHNDFLSRNDQPRQVAFVWHLTKEWRNDWGGEFFWCESNRSVLPSFNTLLLFNVERHSKHFVTMVSPHAEGKRLAINGWWHGRAETTAKQPLSESAMPVEDPVEFI